MSSSAIPQYDIPERQDKLAVFGGSYLTGIPQFLSQWQSNRIVLVASKTLYANTDHIQQLENLLGPKIVGKKIGVGAHSPYPDVIAIAHLLQNNDADCLICIGSSSYTDASKIAAKLAATLPAGFTAKEMEGLVDKAKGAGVAKEAKVKVVMVPTSLSAAEWNGTGSCTNASGKKQHYGVANMREGAPDLVFCDPELASTAPETLWLSSGARCIDHCIETICNRTCTKESEESALTGLAEMVKGLAEYKASVHKDKAQLLKGISDAQVGSREAIKSIIIHRNTGGPSHAIGHQLGSVAGVQHGITTCILLAPTMKYTAASDAPIFERAKLCQPKILDVFNKTLGWHEKDVSAALVRFFKHLGLPTRLSEVNVTDEAQLDKIAEATLTDVWGGGNPQITDKKEVRKILDMAR